MTLIDMRRYRVTIERRDGSYYVSDQRAATSVLAHQAALAKYRAKYGEPADGESHWLLKVVEL